MSANVEFNITAFDEASNVFQEVDSNAQTCFSEITTNASEAAGEVQSATEEMSCSTQDYAATLQQAKDQQDEVNAQYGAANTAVTENTSSLLDNAKAASQAATGMATLGFSVYSLENAKTMLHMQQVTVKRDQDPLNTAQITAEQANIRVQTQLKPTTRHWRSTGPTVNKPKTQRISLTLPSRKLPRTLRSFRPTRKIFPLHISG